MVELFCTTCKAAVPKGTGYSRFPCPSCGETEVVRCDRCKALVNRYKCAKCGFEGP